jgi:hypothetical protein
MRRKNGMKNQEWHNFVQQARAGTQELFSNTVFQNPCKSFLKEAISSTAVHAHKIKSQSVRVHSLTSIYEKEKSVQQKPFRRLKHQHSTKEVVKKSHFL